MLNACFNTKYQLVILSKELDFTLDSYFDIKMFSLEMQREIGS